LLFRIEVTKPYPFGTRLAPTQETERNPMTEYKVTRNRGGEDKNDELPRWMYREVHDHDRRYDCDGHIFVDGPWGGLVCRKCGR
jgi:hypothetical protein